MSKVIEGVNLFYKGGGSDKVYVIQIKEAPGGQYVVDYANGKRGNTLATGTKTQSPVSIEEARKIWEKVVKEKTGKGYAPGGEVGSYMPTELSPELVTGGIQLLNPIDESEVEKYIKDKNYFAQEKQDGQRVQMRRAGGKTAAVNRSGEARGCPTEVIEAVDRLSDDVVLDGEMIGEKYYVFDLLQLDGVDLRPKGAEDRLAALYKLAKTAKWTKGVLTAVETARTTKEKQALFDRLEKEEREGIVFKKASAPYVPGRPASGGDQLKYKFYATLTARVAKVNAKRSVVLELYDGKKWVSIKNVTVSANFSVPKVGALVEIKYLYAYKDGGLAQPIYLGERDDLTEGACTVDQLKYKSGETDEDDS